MAVNVTTTPEALVACAVMFAGSVSLGGVVSCTVMVKVAVPVIPALFVAVQVTVVAVITKVDPEAGTQVGAIAPSTTSVAEAENVTRSGRAHV